MKASTSRYSCFSLNSILVKKALAVTALLLSSQVVLAGGSHPHKWLIDTRVIIENAALSLDSGGFPSGPQCHARGEIRLRSSWATRCLPMRQYSNGSSAGWSDCPWSGWSPWYELDNRGSTGIANAVPYPPPSNEYERRYNIQYRPPQGPIRGIIRYWTTLDSWVYDRDPNTIYVVPAYIPGSDGVMGIRNEWVLDAFDMTDFTTENCSNPPPGGTSTFPITAAAKNDNTDPKMYVVMKKAPAESSKKKKQAKHSTRDHPKRKQLVANLARYADKRPPSRTGKRESLCTRIRLDKGETTIRVCGPKARDANPKLWDARVKLWQWDRDHPPEEEAFGLPPDTPLGPDGQPDPRCYCSEVTFISGGLFDGDWDEPTMICQEGWMQCSQCDSACD